MEFQGMQQRRRRGRSAVVASAALAAFAMGLSFLSSAPNNDEMNNRTRTLQTLLKDVEMDDRMLETPSERPRLRHLYQGGRMGNIMFQYASLIGIAKANNMDPCIIQNGDRSLVHTYFQGKFPVCKDVTTSDGHEEPIWHGGFGHAPHLLPKEKAESEELPSLGDVNLHGFLESNRNFQSAEKEIVETFSFKEDIQSKVAEYMRPFRDKYVTVAIHARRGDKLKDACGATYFQKAMKNISAELQQRGDTRPIMWIVASHGEVVIQTLRSEGEEWYLSFVKKGIFPAQKSQYLGKTPALDMAILQSCDHAILTQGTYSFWVGYLGAWQRRASGGLVLQSNLLEEASSGLDWVTINGCKAD